MVDAMLKFLSIASISHLADEAIKQMDNILGILCFLYDEYKLHSTSSSPIVSSYSIVSGFTDDNFDDHNSFSGRRFRLQVGRSQLDLYLEDLPLELNMSQMF